MTEIKVRYGTPDDVHKFMDLSFLCIEENGLLAPSTRKLLGEVWGSLNLNRGLIGVIEGESGMLEAGILLRIDTMPYSDENILAERAIFVHPDFRSAKGGRASRLCEFAKKAADTLEMPLLIGILSSNRAAGKVRLYERHFGPVSGGYWLYRGKTGMKQNAAE